MDTLKGKRLLILGGNRISCEIVKRAQEMGIYVMVTDWYPIKNSPAKQIADEAFLVSTADVDAVVQLIKEKKVDGVFTGFTDSVLPYYARICEKAGLPCYGTEKQFQIMINKRKYKELCKKFGVPTVEEYTIDDSFKDEDFDRIKYPVLVKPADNSGARGITICRSKEDLKEAYNKAVTFSQSKEVLVERYIEGKEVTTFWFFRDGELYLTALGNRHVKHNQEGVIPLPVAYTFPSVYLDKYQREVVPRVKEMLSSIGIKNGMMFMQCLVEDGNCIVYDIGFRLTGSLEYKLLDKICGYNPLDMMIRFALTGSMYDGDLKPMINPDFEQYAANITFLVRPGIIGKIIGVEEIKKVPGVIDAVLAHVEGDEIPESALGTLRQIVLRAFAVAKTKEELAKIIKQVHSLFHVYSDKGENMLLSNFDVAEMENVVK
ncbi:MAG: ATP-grasp domain-containing protein [Clostridiales bacterium]|nr:ATP-grasp domain-containing protein [Clostridiales bacterium]